MIRDIYLFEIAIGQYLCQLVLWTVDILSGCLSCCSLCANIFIDASAELPKNVKCLMDCEAAEILQGIQDRMVVISADPSIKIPM